MWKDITASVSAIEEMPIPGWGVVFVGVGTVMVVPAFRRGIRSLAKRAIKLALFVTNRTQLAIARSTQGWHDLFAEAHAEANGHQEVLTAEAADLPEVTAQAVKLRGNDQLHFGRCPKRLAEMRSCHRFFLNELYSGGII